MIARFLVALDGPFHLSSSQHYKSFQFDSQDCKVVVYPPTTSILETVPVWGESHSIIQQLEMLAPAEVPSIREDLEINGSPAIEASMLQIDFIKPQFDRCRPVIGGKIKYDPPLEFLFDTLNDVLLAIRILSKASEIKPMSPESLWRVLYLEDDENRVRPEPNKVTGYYFGKQNKRICGITEELWERLPTLVPDCKPPIWLGLLLDGYSLLPDCGPALILAATSLEVLIAQTIRYKARECDVEPEVWDWIKNRGDRRKHPPLEARYDSVLKTVYGKSLKEEEQVLWRAFKELMTIRNNFVHGGQLVGKNDEPVTYEKAAALLEKTREIMNWIETLMPEEYGSKPFALQKTNLSMRYLVKAETDTDSAVMHEIESEIHPKLE